MGEEDEATDRPEVRAGEVRPSDFGEALVESVRRGPKVQDALSDFIELAWDEVAGSTIPEQIPVLKTVLAVKGAWGGVREALLLRKLAAMLQGLGAFGPADRDEIMSRLHQDPDLTEMGDRVVTIIDQVESETKARLVGLMLREYLTGRCARSDFLRSIEMVNRALTEDLSALLVTPVEDLDETVRSRLIAVGLVVDRSSAFLLEESLPPAASAEGGLLRQANANFTP